jgi:hypothetical protein
MNNKIIVISEEDLRLLINECLDSYFKERDDFIFKKVSGNDNEMITILSGISKLLKCSLPTAQ